MKKFAYVLVLVALSLVVTATVFAEGKKEKDMGMGMETVTWTGYLMDTACGVPGVGMDGSDVVNAPWDHTKKCLVACEASGFGISVKDGMEYKYVAFDKKGSDLANKDIVKKTMKQDNIAVQVTGCRDEIRLGKYIPRQRRAQTGRYSEIFGGEQKENQRYYGADNQGNHDGCSE